MLDILVKLKDTSPDIFQTIPTAGALRMNCVLSIINTPSNSYSLGLVDFCDCYGVIETLNHDRKLYSLGMKKVVHDGFPYVLDVLYQKPENIYPENQNFSI